MSLPALKSDQSGLTLTEVLTSVTISLAVLAGAASLLITALNASSRVTDRTNSGSQARTTLEQIGQRLRSQTCLYSAEYSVNGGAAALIDTPPILHASGNRVIYLGDLGNAGGAAGTTNSVGFKPELRWLYVTGVTGGASVASGTFVDGWRDTGSTVAPYNFTITPLTGLTGLASTSGANQLNPLTYRAMADNVTWATGQTRYFTFFDDLGTQITEVTGAVPTMALGSISKVRIAFKILPQNVRNASQATEYSNEYYVRAAADRCE